MAISLRSSSSAARIPGVWMIENFQAEPWDVSPTRESKERIRIPWDYPSPAGYMWCFLWNQHVPHQWKVHQLAKYLVQSRVFPHANMIRFYEQPLTVTTQYNSELGTHSVYAFGPVISFILREEIVIDDQRCVRILPEDFRRIFGTSSDSTSGPASHIRIHPTWKR